MSKSHVELPYIEIVILHYQFHWWTVFVPRNHHIQ